MSKRSPMPLKWAYQLVKDAGVSEEELRQIPRHEIRKVAQRLCAVNQRVRWLRRQVRDKYYLKARQAQALKEYNASRKWWRRAWNVIKAGWRRLISV